MPNTLLKKIKFCLLILLTFCGITIANPVLAATQMPEFNLESALDGKDIDSASFQGQVLLVTFFATWCPPCLQEIPTLINLQDAYGEKGFSVIAISVDQGGTRSVKKLIEKTGINYPVLMADSKVTDDFGGVVGIPTSFIINQKGNITKNYPGYVSHEELENTIEQLMSEIK